MVTINSTRDWNFRSISFWMVMFIGAGLLFIGLRFLTDPATGAEGFGTPFADRSDLWFGRIKGIRDLYCGILLFILLFIGQRRLTALLFGAAIIIPFTDGLIVLTRNGTADVAHIAIHWGTALFCLVAVYLLLRKK